MLVIRQKIGLMSNSGLASASYTVASASKIFLSLFIADIKVHV